MDEKVKVMVSNTAGRTCFSRILASNYDEDSADIGERKPKSWAEIASSKLVEDTTQLKNG